MAFCKQCGASVEDGMKFCTSCGAPVEQAQQQQASSQNDYAQKIKDLNNTADTTDEFDREDIEKNKVMAILAYISWLVLIPIFAAKDSKFARFHVNQGLVLAIVEILFWIAAGIVTSIIPILGIILNLANIVFFIVSIIGILNAANGKAKELPVIGKFKIFK